MRSEVPDELVVAFTAAVETVLRDWAGADAVRRDTAAAGPAGVSVAMRLELGAGWWAVLSLPEPTAAALARRVLAGAEPDDGLVRDCAGELLNVVAGQAKTLLYGTPLHYSFTTPTAAPAGLATGAAIGFESDCGPFALRLGPAADGEGSPGARSEG